MMETMTDPIEGELGSLVMSGWIADGGQDLTRPVSDEWGQVARGDGRVVLVVGYEPRTGETEDEYTDAVMASGRFVIGLLTLS